MVEYYSALLNRHQGVTQRDTLMPTHFNVLIDVVFRHWILVVAEEDVVSKGFDMATQKMPSFFYVDYGIIYSTFPP